MKIFKLEEQYLVDLKESINDPSDIKVFFEDEFPLDESKIKEVGEVNLPTLKTKSSYGFESRNKYDYENAINLYESLNFSRVVASDEKIWSYLSLTFYYEYIKERHIPRNGSNQYFFDNNNILKGQYKEFLNLNSSDQNSVKNFINSTIFIKGKGRRDKRRHALSRLWWAVELTVSPWEKYNMIPVKDDKYYYTKILINKSDLWLNLFERILGLNPFTLFSIIDIIEDKKLGQADVRKFLININSYLSFRDLNHFDYNTITNDLKKCIDINE